ncbi:hypothetical protein [Gimesia maris]|uniref:hypothetical protein n=1 Tax=Gimesia maris TaxID=122 RepID=UPI0030DC77F9
MQTTVGSVQSARFDLLTELGLAEPGEALHAHSVLMQHQTEFTIYLPPHRVKSTMG